MNNGYTKVLDIYTWGGYTKVLDIYTWGGKKVHT